MTLKKSFTKMNTKRFIRPMVNFPRECFIQVNTVTEHWRLSISYVKSRLYQMQIGMGKCSGVMQNHAGNVWDISHIREIGVTLTGDTGRYV